MKRTGFILLLLIIFTAACSANREMQRRQADSKREVGVAHLRHGNYSLALRELLSAEKLNPDNADIQNDLGFAYLQRDKLDLAVEHFKKALELKPDFPSAKNNLGVAYMRQKKWDVAIAIFKDLTQNLLYATPQNPMVNLGWIYYNKKEFPVSEKYYAEAIQLYREGLPKDLTYIEALRGQSLTYIAMGRHKEAVASLELAIKDAPRAAQLFFDLGEAYTLSQELDKAFRAYQKVIELAPESNLAEKAKREAAKLEALRK